VSLGVRDTFADMGATVADALGVHGSGLAGSSFLGELGPA
jgi:phosphopentomutase